MTATSIEWTDETWNPLRGCSRVSEGCRNCYAEGIAARFSGEGQPYEGLAKRVGTEPRWTGKVIMAPDKVVVAPLHWREPRRVFVNSMSDLFHESVPDEWIDRVFAVMALAPQHTFQILTKRPERMHAYMKKQGNGEIARAVLDLMIAGLIPKNYINDDTYDQRWPVASDHPDDVSEVWLKAWPLPNVWLGVSIENQVTADERIPLLLDMPAAVRFISAEPLLGAVDLSPPADQTYQRLSEWYGPDGFDPTGSQPRITRRHDWFPKIDWLICGGESGPTARPMHPDWARSLRDQCRRAGVPFFFKQWGEWKNGSDFKPDAKAVLTDGRVIDADKTSLEEADRVEPVMRHNPTLMRRVGKKAAGDLLDDVRHHEWPDTQP